jgi:hypothetical protein
MMIERELLGVFIHLLAMYINSLSSAAVWPIYFIIILFSADIDFLKSRCKLDIHSPWRDQHVREKKKRRGLRN